jgi:hypothetical protein
MDCRRLGLVVAFACSQLSACVWVANYLELTWVRPTACTFARTEVESWLFMARVLACVLPLVGLVASLRAARPWSRMSAVALLSNVGVLAAVIVAFSVPMPGRWAHLPCLRS